MVARNTESTPTNTTHVELRADRELVITRTFNAPAHLVFDAWTKPELVKRWWAPKSHGVTVVVCDADVRVGGKYRYVLRLDSGDEIGFSGEYSEVTPPSRLVYTQVFEPMAHAGAVMTTITFRALGAQTHLTAHEIYPSKEAREAALSSGMEHGMRETFEQLEELVASLR